MNQLISQVHEDDRGGFEIDGLIDLELLAGRRVRMTQGVACTILETTRPTLRKLMDLEVIDEGELAEGRGANMRWVVLDPGKTRRDLYLDWVQGLGVPQTHFDFDRYLRVREVCIIPPGELPPPTVVEGMVPLLMQLGAQHPSEFGAFTPTHHDTESELRKLIFGASQLVDRRRLPPGARPSNDMILAASPALRGAPGTCFEQPLGSNDFARPNDHFLRQVWTLGPLRAAALFWLHLSAASYRRSSAMQKGVTQWRLLDDALTAQRREANPADPQAITEALESIASSQDSGSTDARARACLALGKMIRDLSLYASRHDPDGTLGIRGIVPAHHRDRIEFTKRLRVTHNDIALNGRIEHKHEIEEAADRFEELTEIAALRMEQIRATCEDALAAAQELAGTIDAQLPSATYRERRRYVDFSVPTTVMSSKGELLTGSQLCHWRVWRERDLWLDMADAKGKLNHAEDDMVIRTGKTIDKDPTAYGRLVYEWRGCAPLTGASAIEPWFVSISNSGALIAPASMQAGLRASRHQFIVDWNIPAYAGSAKGLLSYDRAHSTLWRYMADRGRHVVPVEQFAFAMRFAHLGFSAVDETICRLSEFMQMRQDRDTWPITGETGAEEVSFLAIPKTSAINPSFEAVPFGVSQELFLEADDLARDVARMGGDADGILSEIMCAQQLSDKYKEPQAWTFQFGGEAVRGQDMNRFLAFLLANVVDVTFHDLRHASASAAECAGVPLASLQRLMNHHKREMTSYYAGKTRRRKALVEATKAKRRKVKMSEKDARLAKPFHGFDI